MSALHNLLWAVGFAALAALAAWLHVDAVGYTVHPSMFSLGGAVACAGFLSACYCSAQAFRSER